MCQLMFQYMTPFWGGVMFFGMVLFGGLIVALLLLSIVWLIKQIKK